jgi:hypothetical protein
MPATAIARTQIPISQHPRPPLPIRRQRTHDPLCPFDC